MIGAFIGLSVKAENSKTHERELSPILGAIFFSALGYGIEKAARRALG